MAYALLVWAARATGAGWRFMDALAIVVLLITAYLCRPSPPREQVAQVHVRVRNAGLVHGANRPGAS